MSNGIAASLPVEAKTISVPDADRFKEANSNVRTLLQLYVQWYIFVWTINVAALAFVFAGKVSSLSDYRPVAWVFVFNNAFGALSCVIIAKVVCGMMTRISNELKGSGAASQPVRAWDAPAIPCNFIWYALIVNALSLVLMLGFWVYLALR